MQLWKKKLLDSNWVKREPASVESIAALENQIGADMPVCYRKFLLWSDGGRGKVNQSYLKLLSCEEVVAQHKGYRIAEYLPGFILIGNDGGDCFYFLRSSDSSDLSVMMFLSGAFFEDEGEMVGSSFEAFILSL
jgi:hypothetical protein